VIKKEIILSLFIFFYSFANSQNITDKRNIVWKNKVLLKVVKKNKTNNYVLNFKDAIFDFSKNYLPTYFESIDANAEKFNVSLKNTVFEKISKKELKNIKGLHKVNEKIKIKHSVLTERKNKKLHISFIPIKRNNIDEYFKLVSFNLSIKAINNYSNYKKQKKAYAHSSVLSSGKWIKIKIKESGIYRITLTELTDLGISSLENIRIFGNGGSMLSYQNAEPRADDLIENHILIENDAVFFYGDGITQWEYDENSETFIQKKHLYSDFAYYFLSSEYNSQINNKIQTVTQSGLPKTHNANNFSDYDNHEVDSLNLLKSGRQWVGEHFDFNTTYNFNFSLPNIIAGSTTVLNTSLLTRSPSASSFIIQANGSTFSSTFGLTSYNPEHSYANQKKETFSFINSSSNEINVKLTYNKSTASSQAWLDYITVNVKRSLIMSGSQMDFRNVETVGNSNVTEFTLSNAPSSVKIWDITNPQQPKNVSTTQSGNNQVFKLETNELREFIAFDGSSYLSAIIDGDDIGNVNNQNLHGITQSDMVIVCPEKFLTYAEQLKSLHQNSDNLSVTLVSPQQIYNEFSSGIKDVSAIRDFMKMLYDRANTDVEMPKYLLLFGDGSYDNKNNNNENTNLILTYQSENSLNPVASFVSDDFFGLLDDDEGETDGLLDIGIGRLPVSTQEQAQNAVNKILNYVNVKSYSNFRNKLCFVADDEDKNVHINQADDLTNIVKNNYPNFNIKKIYIDAYKQEISSSGQRYPDVNETINNQLSKGLLIFNYTGHGGVLSLAEERIITKDQINKWEHKYKLPVFMTATCEFSRFDDYTKTSAGEFVFLNPHGGAISMFTTTRLVYSSPNYTLNKNFYKYIFENNPITNKRYKLGDVFRLTKVATGDNNKRNFTLFGDPALSLSYAYKNIVTTLINGVAVSTDADTLKAYQKVIIQGEIRNNNNQKITNYNGIIYPSVYDKERTVKTLNNDNIDEGPFEYKVRNNIIFQGKASVKNGDFKFSFIVPKDIRYNVDTGKISYYAQNNLLLQDAKGYDKNILIGSTSDNYNIDNIGPQINIFFNDESFVSGGITNESPSLLLQLNDESGINTTGVGIGHDIIATIDNDANKQFNLNDYYEANIDDYTSGEVKYNFSGLEIGEHKLNIKAWDVYNNSSEDSIIFVVTDTDGMKINHVLNYPNPFSSNTSFFFEHNRPNELLEILIQIFTVSGKLVKTIRTNAIYAGFRSDGIIWNGKDNFENKIGRGVYFYKLSVKTQSGEKDFIFEKVLKL